MGHVMLVVDGDEQSTVCSKMTADRHPTWSNGEEPAQNRLATHCGTPDAMPTSAGEFPTGTVATIVGGLVVVSITETVPGSEPLFAT